MSEQIIEQARILGELLAQCDELREMRDAEEKLTNDPIAQNLINEINAQQNKAQMINSQGRDLNDAEKAEYDRVEQQVKNNATIAQYLRAQGNFANLLDSVNYLIMKEINGEPDSCDSGSCGGGCSGCGC